MLNDLIYAVVSAGTHKTIGQFKWDLSFQFEQHFDDDQRINHRLQAVLHGGIGPQPVIDSLVVVEVLLELETQVPFELPDSLVRAGGYDSVDEEIGRASRRATG